MVICGIGDTVTDPVVKSFRVTMSDEEFQIFTAIKKSLGLRADAEVFRYLMNYYNKRELHQKKDAEDAGWVKVEEGWIE